MPVKGQQNEAQAETKIKQEYTERVAQRSAVLKGRNTLLQWIIRFLKGFIVGFGAIVPGLSGGVLAVILGVYDQIMRFLGNLTHQFRQNIRYFLPIGLGGGLGILVFAKIIKAAFGTYAALFTALFIGFVAGTFPSIFQTAGQKGRKASDLALMALTAIALFGLMLIGGKTLTQVQPNLLVWFFCGAITALGFIVPGLSPSNFLIYFGLYDKMAAGIESFDFTMLIPFIIGAVLCVIALAKLVNFLFARAYSKMYHAICGLVVGSTLAIFPTVIFPAFTVENLVAMKLSAVWAAVGCLLMFALGVIISLLFGRLEKKFSPQS